MYDTKLRQNHIIYKMWWHHVILVWLDNIENGTVR